MESLDEFAVNQLLVETGFVGDFKTVTCEDVWADLAAAGFDEGAVFLVSTGSNVFVRGSSGEHLNVGGWGSEIDDLGSGFFVGRLALGKILQHVDGRAVVSKAFVQRVLEVLLDL